MTATGLGAVLKKSRVVYHRKIKNTILNDVCAAKKNWTEKVVVEINKTRPIFFKKDERL